MKKLLLLAVSVLSLAFVVSGALSIGFSTGLDQIWLPPGGRAPDGRAVAVLLPSERDPFWDELIVSLRRDGEERGLAYEVIRYSPSGANAREIIEKASLSLVDALLCYPPDALDVSDVVDAVEARGVPVLLLENDLPQSRRRVFLGASSFQMGYEVGKILVRLEGVRRGGVLLSQSDRSRQTVKNSLFLNGLNEGLSGRPGVSMVEVISPPGRFAGEELVWSLLRREPAIQVLVTTNPKDTSSALQTIVEANRVGKTRLVGLGEDESLRSALAQGMVSGLILREPDEWAELISSTLETLLSGEPVSSYITLPTHAISPGEALGEP